ncbi:uncharacterized protein LOC106154257 [Lingula anatina]|uniref:Uncharacterized protein LOC106154257 n=1 Tax=Lingula anatina TaxID=7574 RepID=A0A1S3HD83_LINAN|nr:uncharacterized protein LOC106154257 [Lingula anatina]|eukprot:XP_013384002.1 uncharacterized protein LOC106154257 [Lingula anatina]
MTGQVPVAVAISGWISTAVVLILVGVVIVVIKRRGNPIPQPFADTYHSDTPGLNQNSLSPSNSADREDEYMSLEDKTMSTVSRVAEYVNVNDSDYTALGMPANESNQRQPKAAGIYQNEM